MSTPNHDYRVMDMHEIEELAKEVYYGGLTGVEDTPDDFFDNHMFYGNVPDLPWPSEAMDQSIAFLRAYGKLVKSDERVIGIDEAWDIVKASEESEANTSRLTIADMGRRSGVGFIRIQEQLKNLGFIIKGEFQHKEIVQGPCVVCGRIFAYEGREKCGPCLVSTEKKGE